MSKFRNSTPGPWRAENVHLDMNEEGSPNWHPLVSREVTAPGSIIAHLDTYKKTPEEVKTNAILISAVQDILEALEAYRVAVDYSAVKGRSWQRKKAYTLMREARLKDRAVIDKLKRG